MAVVVVVVILLLLLLMMLLMLLLLLLLSTRNCAQKIMHHLVVDVSIVFTSVSFHFPRSILISREQTQMFKLTIKVNYRVEGVIMQISRALKYLNYGLVIHV